MRASERESGWANERVRKSDAQRESEKATANIIIVVIASEQASERAAVGGELKIVHPLTFAYTQTAFDVISLRISHDHQHQRRCCRRRRQRRDDTVKKLLIEIDFFPPQIFFFASTPARSDGSLGCRSLRSGLIWMIYFASALRNLHDTFLMKFTSAVQRHY